MHATRWSTGIYSGFSPVRSLARVVGRGALSLRLRAQTLSRTGRGVEGRHRWSLRTAVRDRRSGAGWGAQELGNSIQEGAGRDRSGFICNPLWMSFRGRPHGPEVRTMAAARRIGSLGRATAGMSRRLAIDPSACRDHCIVEHVVAGLRMTSNALRAFIPHGRRNRETTQTHDDIFIYATKNARPVGRRAFDVWRLATVSGGAGAAWRGWGAWGAWRDRRPSGPRWRGGAPSRS